MNEEAMLHAAVAENPYEHDPILLLADHYDENGRPGTAYFLRSVANKIRAYHQNDINLGQEPSTGETRKTHASYTTMNDENPSSYRVASVSEHPKYEQDEQSGQLGDDLVVLNMPQAHKPGKHFTFTSWIPRRRGKALIGHLEQEGFTPEDPPHGIVRDRSIIINDPRAEPSLYKRLGKRIKYLRRRLHIQSDLELTIPHGTDLMRFAKEEERRVWKTLKGEPYVFIKNQFGWGVTNTGQGHSMTSRNYQVYCDDAGNPINCSCPDNVYRKHECKHMKAVREIGGEMPASDTETKVEGEPTKESARSRVKRPSRMEAYRAPAGGLIARGTAYKGGEMVPDMEGSFMNPSKLKALVVSYRTRRKPMKYSRESDMAGFHQAMHENPSELHNYGVYADWLEEQGMPTHAHIIRHEVGVGSPMITDYSTSFTRPGMEPGQFWASRRMGVGQGKDIDLLQRSLHDPSMMIWWTKAKVPDDERAQLYNHLLQEGAIADSRDDEEEPERMKAKKRSAKWTPKPKRVPYVPSGVGDTTSSRCG